MPLAYKFEQILRPPRESHVVVNILLLLLFHLSWSFFKVEITNRSLIKISEWRIYSNFSLVSSSFNDLSNSLKISEWVKMLYDYRVTAVKLMKIIWNFYDAFKSKSNFIKELKKSFSDVKNFTLTVTIIHRSTAKVTQI